MTMFILGFVVVIMFGFVVVYGAPYLPTMKKQAESALDLMELKPGQTLLELGCGDGRVAVLAAKRGLRVVGYELNPLLALGAKIRTLRYRSKVKIYIGNFWTKKWPDSDGIYVFLMDRFMNKLDKKVTQYSRGKRIKLASYTFQIAGKKPSAAKNGIFLYIYND